MLKELFYISNIFSIFRIILLFPLCYLLVTDNEGNRVLIIAILIGMYVTDLLDGFLARKLNQVTELGKIIDPLADKISVVTLVLILLLQSKIPLWFVLIVVLRDVLILLFGLILKGRKKITLMSNYPGKIAVFSIGVVILISTLNLSALKNFQFYLMLLSTALIFYSSFLYFKRFNQTIGEKNGTRDLH
ncbi:MAG: CDP-alcohol phosphatidyltransferase family protein [Bacteroidetes bacterium]|nr:CDP-alcohol phosphatidyltransferase family protein [Bacteroidota bacterium]MBX7044288.1 CDP-alcohol phosphatidyltransferase family protein [Ignavibacteria bacterium]